MSTSAATLADLAGVARVVEDAQQTAIEALALSARGRHAEAQDTMQETADKLAAAQVRLQLMGAPDQTPATATERGDFAELASLDTPEARALLSELRPLVDLAERLDRSRGDWYPDTPGDQPKGTNYAESLYNMVCRLELETSGPKGRE